MKAEIMKLVNRLRDLLYDCDDDAFVDEAISKLGCGVGFFDDEIIAAGGDAE